MCDLVQRSAELTLYNKDNELVTKFIANEMSEAYNKFISKIKPEINLNDLTKEDCKFLGFRSYKVENGITIQLIPLYLLSILKDSKGLEVYNIIGNKYIVGKDLLSNEHRFGMLAYGLKVNT